MEERITVADCRPRALSDPDSEFLRVIIALEVGLGLGASTRKASFLAMGDIELQLITGCLLRVSNYFICVSLDFSWNL